MWKTYFSIDFFLRLGKPNLMIQQEFELHGKFEL